MNWMFQSINDGISTIMVVSGPIVIVAALIGLLVGIVQAATQVQEQTVQFTLKAVGIVALIFLSGTWMFNYLQEFTQKLVGRSFTYVLDGRKPVQNDEETTMLTTFAQPFRNRNKRLAGNSLNSGEIDPPDGRSDSPSGYTYEPTTPKASASLNSKPAIPTTPNRNQPTTSAQTSSLSFNNRPIAETPLKSKEYSSSPYNRVSVAKLPQPAKSYRKPLLPTSPEDSAGDFADPDKAESGSDDKLTPPPSDTWF